MRDSVALTCNLLETEKEVNEKMSINYSLDKDVYLLFKMNAN